MKNDKKKLNDKKCSLVAGGNSSGIHYIYQCSNCGKGEITAACDINWCSNCGKRTIRKVDEVFLDLDSNEPNYGVPREIMGSYNIPDF